MSLYRQQKTPIPTYLKCIRKCGVRMVANSNLSAVIKFPRFHNPVEETEENQKDIRPQTTQEVQKDPTELLKESFDNVLERKPTESCPEYHSIKSSLIANDVTNSPPPQPQMLTLDIRGRLRKNVNGCHISIKTQPKLWCCLCYPANAAKTIGN